MRLLAVLAPLLLAGCVERMLEIRSEPAQADVYRDGERLGQTPIVINYEHYGTREITLVKEGYRSHRQLVVLNSPWWQVFPFDLITDVVLPFTFTDRVELAVTLEKEPPLNEAIQETLKRAEEARKKASPPEESP
jgi:hypothetical protein